MQVVYKPPSGPYVISPTLPSLHELLLKGEEYWQNNAGCGTIITGDGPLFDENRLRTSDVCSLSLTRKDPFGFILLYSAASASGDEMSVAVSSKDYSQTTTVFMGDDWKVPTAFFVSNEQAMIAISDFYSNGNMSSRLTWVRVSDQQW